MFCFMPLLSQPLIGFVPLPQSAGGKRGGLATALGLVLCLVVAAAVWNVYARCRPETRVEPRRDDLEADGARDDDRGDRICPPDGGGSPTLNSQIACQRRSTPARSSV